MVIFNDQHTYNSIIILRIPSFNGSHSKSFMKNIDSIRIIQIGNQIRILFGRNFFGKRFVEVCQIHFGKILVKFRIKSMIVKDAQNDFRIRSAASLSLERFEIRTCFANLRPSLFIHIVHSLDKSQQESFETEQQLIREIGFLPLTSFLKLDKTEIDRTFISSDKFQICQIYLLRC